MENRHGIRTRVNGEEQAAIVAYLDRLVLIVGAALRWNGKGGVVHALPTGWRAANEAEHPAAVVAKGKNGITSDQVALNVNYVI